jgi:succinoglycan biosynthesis transport protein ExoP
MNNDLSTFSGPSGAPNVAQPGDPVSLTMHMADKTPGSDEQQKTFPEILAILRKRARLILSVGALFAGAAGLYCLFASDIYTARTTLEIRGYAPLLATSSSEILLGNDTRKIEYQKTTVAKLKLEGLADEALARDAVLDDLREYWDSRRSPIGQAFASVTNLFGKEQHSSYLAESDSHYLHKPSIINKYLSLLTVTPMHETNLVTVSVSTSLPELSQKIANIHAVAFMEHLQRERKDAMSANLQLLQRQATELKNRVAQAETALSSYAAEHKLLTINDQAGATINVKQIESLGGLLAEATARRIKSETLRNEALSKKAGDFSVTDSEVTRQLQVTLKQAEAEYATLGSKVTPAFPAMMELKAKMDSLRKAIGDERKRSLRDIDSTYQSDKEAETRLRQQIDTERSSAQAISQRLIQYNVLNKEAASLRDLYQAVLKQAKEIEISSQTSASNVFVSDFASMPTSPSAPKRNLILILFTLLGLGTGTILALFVESLDTTIRTPDEAQRSLDLPLLGAVPQFIRETPTIGAELPPLLTRGTNDAATGSPNNPNSPPPPNASNKVQSSPPALSANGAILEALKTIRAGILLSSADHPPRVIMVSSAITGEGKSTILCNLAATLAQAHHKTLMIDGDLRVSGLSRMFESRRQNSSVGLTDLLTGQAHLSQVISPTTVENLDILRAGHRAPNPAELLGSFAMKGVMNQLLDRYDFILVDSPPVLPVADGLVLSRLVDSVLMVVRSRVTDRKLAQEARRRLSRVHARILGIVLNDVDPRDDLFDVSTYGEYLPIETSR